MIFTVKESQLYGVSKKNGTPKFQMVVVLILMQFYHWKENLMYFSMIKNYQLKFIVDIELNSIITSLKAATILKLVPVRFCCCCLTYCILMAKEIWYMKTFSFISKMF